MAQTEQVKTWTCPTLEAALKEITGQSYVNVTWCDERGRMAFSKDRPAPTLLSATLIREPYVEYKLTRVPGYVRHIVRGEIRSDGPGPFVLVKEDTVFIQAIFRSGRTEPIR